MSPAFLWVIGRLLLLEALALCAPLVVARGYGDGVARGEIQAFTYAILVAMLLGLALAWLLRDRAREIGTREAFASVVIGWIVLTLVGAIPLRLCDGCAPTYVDAVFEVMSGFTTTGASIFPDVEHLPHGILFWRAFTHWLGGMGIVVLSLAVLPTLGAGGFLLMKAEVSGAAQDKIRPRIKATAAVLWSVYTLFTVVGVIAFAAGGMPLFDSVCHTFAAISSGGFSTRNTSFADQGPYLQYVAIFLMFVAGVNFSLHDRVLKGEWRAYARDGEFRFFVLIIAIATAICAASLLAGGGVRVEEAIRQALFQVVSLITTTGFASADFDRWANAARIAIFALWFIGGCAGSTSGGPKVIRVLILLKIAWHAIVRLVRPRAVVVVKIGGEPVDRSIITGATALFALWLLTFLVSTIAVGALTRTGDARADLETAASSVATCLAGCGPGFAGVGPMTTYTEMHAGAKVILAFCMLLGRMEILSILLLLTPHFWRR